MSESEDTDIIPAPTSIVRAPTGITALNSSLARPAIPSQDSLAKVTHYKLDLDTILDGLIPDPLPVSGGKDNAIHHLNIIIFGKPNTGKTTLAESISQALARRYGQRNVKALRASRDLPGLFQNIDKLFGRFRKPPNAILLFADDMTKALRELAGTAFVAKTGSGVFRVPRPSVSTKWLMRNVGSSETSQELAVEVDEPRKKSAVEEVESKRRTSLEERPAVQPKQHLQPKQHRSKRGRRVAIVVVAAGILMLAVLAWKYVWPFLKI